MAGGAYQVIKPRSAKKKKPGYEIAFFHTDYGFQYGAVLVSRLLSDISDGSVVIGLGTDKEAIQVRVTRTGRIRVHNVKAA